jgi:hypothetical protein
MRSCGLILRFWLAERDAKLSCARGSACSEHTHETAPHMAGTCTCERIAGTKHTDMSADSQGHCHTGICAEPAPSGVCCGVCDGWAPPRASVSTPPVCLQTTHLAACRHDEHVTWVVVPQLVGLDELSWVNGGTGGQITQTGTDTTAKLSTHSAPAVSCRRLAGFRQ